MSMAKMTFSELRGDLTAEELKEIEAAERLPAVFDEDSPAMTAEQLEQFRRVNRENRVKQTVSLRVSPATLKKARQYGKGYTSLLSRLLDEAINDEEMVRRCI